MTFCDVLLLSLPGVFVLNVVHLMPYNLGTKGDRGFVDIRDNLGELSNRQLSIFYHCFLIILSETDGHPERCLHTVGNERPPAQCFLFTENESESVVRTSREKRVRAPSLTAAKPRLSIANSSPRSGLREGELCYTPVLPDHV
ncbi:hypothetical protein Trydic_g1350 [Trypoxylus dichotomus]